MWEREKSSFSSHAFFYNFATFLFSMSTILTQQFHSDSEDEDFVPDPKGLNFGFSTSVRLFSFEWILCILSHSELSEPTSTTLKRKSIALDTPFAVKRSLHQRGTKSMIKKPKNNIGAQVLSDDEDVLNPDEDIASIRKSKGMRTEEIRNEQTRKEEKMERSQVSEKINSLWDSLKSGMRVGK